MQNDVVKIDGTEPNHRGLGSSVLATLIVTVTVGFAALHWAFPAIAEVAKDSFEPLPLHLFPVNAVVRDRILFSGLGFLLSASGLLLLNDLWALRTSWVFFVLGHLRLLFVFLGSAVVTLSIIGNALWP